jgi:hypothetical protein
VPTWRPVIEEYIHWIGCRSDDNYRSYALIGWDWLGWLALSNNHLQKVSNLEAQVMQRFGIILTRSGGADLTHSTRYHATTRIGKHEREDHTRVTSTRLLIDGFD